MSRRVFGLLAALLLATFGTVVLVAYVRSAEERALAGEQLIEVYVVDQPIPAGTPGEELAELVSIEQVPVKVRANQSVESLAALAGRVSAVDLLPGEQLVDGRFVERTEFADRVVGVQVPDDMVEITVALDPERAVGGLVEPGQTVAVFASFEPFQLSATVVEVDGEEVALPTAVADSVDGSTPNTTDLLLRKVLVTAVQETETNTIGGRDEVNRLDFAPEDQVFVTLAVPPSAAERVVFTAEFGTIWLAVEQETVPESDDAIRTRGNVYQDDPANR